MPIQDEILKRLANRIKYAKRSKDQAEVDRLCAGREEYKKNQNGGKEPKAIAIKRHKPNTMTAGSSLTHASASSVQDSVSQSHWKEVSDAVTESIIETRLDGTKTEKKTTRTITVAEETTQTMARKVESLRSVSIENYSSLRMEEYGTDHQKEKRIGHVLRVLQELPSHYDENESLLESIRLSEPILYTR